MNNRIVAERFLDNKKLVVIANPGSQVINVSFYKDNKLLTDDSEFTWDSNTKLEFDQDLNNLYGLVITENNVEKVASDLVKYLKYSRDDYFNYITIDAKFDTRKVGYIKTIRDLIGKLLKRWRAKNKLSRP